MFIRELFKSNKGSKKVYKYHVLVEAVRTARGPRQRQLLNLGTLELERDKWPLLAAEIKDRVTGQTTLIRPPADIAALAETYAHELLLKFDHQGQPLPEDQCEQIELSSVQAQRCRSLGPEFAALSFLDRLGVRPFLADLGLTPRQVEIACLLIIGRLCSPGSERHLYQWSRFSSGLDELLETDFSHLSLNSLYEVSDHLIRHQTRLEHFLRERERTLFSLDEKLILYDLSNTFFEGGAARNPKAKFGRSKEKRSDCRLVTLGLVLDGQGFPKASRVFDGNQSEPHTLLTMVKGLEACSQPDHDGSGRGEGGLKKTVVMDAGIATEENLKLLSESYHYVCVSRKRSGLPEPHGSSEVIKQTKDLTIQACRAESGDEVYLFCQSTGKKKKERGIQSRLEQRFEEQLGLIAAAIHRKGGTKKYAKVCERIGRVRERYKRIAHYYDVVVLEQDGYATSVTWEYTRQVQSDHTFSGSYVLRTDRTDLTNEEIWKLYLTLLEVEDAFRTLKSELGIRPNFHQKEHRSDGHLFITVLAYHLLHSIRTTLKDQGMSYRWTTIRHRLSTHQRVTTRLRTKGGKTHFIRSSSAAEPFHKSIYTALGLDHNSLKKKYYSF